jgi:ring-1,2-phenylacetyl-CoA epoxidase subunit PaaC
MIKMNPTNNNNITKLLHFADNVLVLGHRNSEWCGHGPILEQDIAITNISLDLIGQARNFYQYAAKLINESPGGKSQESTATEDSLAYLRDVRDFRNCLLVEQPNGDWGQTILRQFFFSAYQYYLYQQIQELPDEHLAAIAAKALKEVTYHLRWSSEWVIRLGDGTEESHHRILKSLDELWPYTGEMFQPVDYELESGIDFIKLKSDWDARVKSVLVEATLPIPAGTLFMHTGGKTGTHTEHLGYILAEMQFMQRAYPNCEW